MAQQRHYYSNPAFCQKSEYYPQDATSPRQRTLSPERRQSPVGAQKPTQVENYNSPPRVGPKPRTLPRKNIKQTYNEPEFEEMLVDDTPISPQRKKEIDNYQNDDHTNGNNTYTYNGNEDNTRRYTIIQAEEEYIDEPKKSRYEYIPMQEQGMRPQKVIRKSLINQEEVEIAAGRFHRYAVIPVDEENQRCNRDRYAETPNEEIRYVEEPPRTNKGRYAEIPEEIPQKRYVRVPIQEEQRNQNSYIKTDEDIPKKHIKTERNQGRYAEIPVQVERKPRYAVVPVQEEEVARYSAPPKTQKHRYEYIEDIEANYQREYPNIKPQTPRKGNPEATQKLHELLITPQKFQKVPIKSPQSQRKNQSLDPFVTPNKTPPKIVRNSAPKAQQKLNYTLSTRQNIYDKRQNTAVIAPICSSPVQSVYSETTFSNKTESWMNLSTQKAPVQVTLAVAAFMMILCGGLSSGLCFYMVSIFGRMYYLDFGIISGFACLLLGCLGFRSRNCHWLPNRNYISGKLY